MVFFHAMPLRNVHDTNNCETPAINVTFSALTSGKAGSPKLMRNSLSIYLWTDLDTLGYTFNKYGYLNPVVNSFQTLSLCNDPFKSKYNG